MSTYNAFANRCAVILCALPMVLGLASCQHRKVTEPRPSGDDRAYLLEQLRSPVMSVAVAPNGLNLAAGCFDGTIRIWGLKNGEPGPSLAGHRDVVTGLGFTPDGRILISASRDKTVKLWDFNTGNELTTFHGHQAAITSLALGSDGTWLASAGPYDARDQPLPGDVRLWNLATGQQKDLGDLPKKIWGVTSLALTPKGDGVILASTDGTITLWDLVERKSKTVFKGHRDMVWCVALSDDGKTLATGDTSGLVKLWDVVAGMELHSLHAAPGMQNMAFAPGGLVLATVARDRTVRFWDTANGRNLATVNDEDSHPGCLAFTPDGHTLVCGRGQFDQGGRPLVGDTKVWSLDRVLPPDPK